MCERDCERDLQEAIPRAAGSAGVARHVHSHDRTLTCFAFSPRIVRSSPRILREKRDCSQSNEISNQHIWANNLTKKICSCATIRLVCDQVTVEVPGRPVLYAAQKDLFHTNKVE